MKNVKFWLVQIAMVAIVSLAFSSAGFATPPDHAKGEKGVEMKNDKANDNAKANANDKAGFENDVVTPADVPVCAEFWNGICIAWN
jgi:hypothetical protein